MIQKKNEEEKTHLEACFCVVSKRNVQLTLVGNRKTRNSRIRFFLAFFWGGWKWDLLSDVACFHFGTTKNKKWRAAKRSRSLWNFPRFSSKRSPNSSALALISKSHTHNNRLKVRRIRCDAAREGERCRISNKILSSNILSVATSAHTHTHTPTNALTTIRFLIERCCRFSAIT